MKYRLRDLMACGCILGGAATTVFGQLLLDDKPEVGFLATVVGFVLFVTGMAIALISIGRHFLTNGFEVLHPGPDAVNQSEQPRRWRPWWELVFFSVVCVAAIVHAVRDHSVWGWIAAALAAAIVAIASWQLLRVWQNLP